MRVLVNGTAGFIGFHVARAVMARGDAVTGFDNVNDYYDVELKEARLTELDRAADVNADLNLLRSAEVKFPTSAVGDQPVSDRSLRSFAAVRAASAAAEA